jgi:MoxR-like ATPase
MEVGSDLGPPADIDPGSDDYPQEEFQYRRTFRPKRPKPPDRDAAMQGGDRARHSPYAYDEQIILAVNTALAANRPLLVAGPPGTGKSALAADIAKQLDRDPDFNGRVGFVQTAITGRTEGRDLLWRFDTVRRLRDAQLAAVNLSHMEAGADDDVYAPERGTDDEPLASENAADGEQLTPEAGAARDPLAPKNYLSMGVLWEAFDASKNARRMVVLIDEIDKADPDVPNSLLEVLGNGRFHIDELDDDIIVDDDYAPFIVITTNDERELSRPFRRRCVTLTLRAPKAKRLLEIATAQGLATGYSDPDQPSDWVIATRLADKIEGLAGTDEQPGQLTPNAAEYLDALRACLGLGVVSLDSVEWEAIKEATLLKSLRPDGEGR